MHDIPLITTIAAGLTAALVMGLLTQRMGLSPIVGYLLGGVLIGPHTPGFVGDTHLASQLAELGVILLMFGVGLHFHVKDMLAVKNLAIPGALVQSTVATLLGLAVAWGFGWSLKSGLVIGMAMAVASTVVLMRVLMDSGRLDSTEGHVAVGWLVVEDILTVLLLVMLPVLDTRPVVGEGEGHGALVTLGIALVKLAVLTALVLVAGGRIIPWILVQVARLRSRELFTLTVLVLAIAIATGASVFFHVSMALGAFLAGMVVGQTPVSQQAGADALPMRDAFAVLFFVSVGMLFDPKFLVQQPLLVLAALGVVLIGKPLAALAIVGLLGHSLRTGLTVAIGLAQIGEFSFILAKLALDHELIPTEGQSMLVACAIVSITINPMLFKLVDPIENWVRARPKLWNLLNARAEARLRQTNAACTAAVAGQSGSLAIVVGYGPVGRTVDKVLRDSGIETVVIDLNMNTIEELNKEGRHAIYGDASHAAILEAAGIARSSHLLITLPHSANRNPLVTAARQINPKVRILVRARYISERDDLIANGVDGACFEEAEAARELGRLTLEELRDGIRESGSGTREKLAPA